MATLRWRAADVRDDETLALAMASRFRVRRHRDVPRFLLDSLRVRRQVLRAPGVVGLALRARVRQREFLTLSAWEDSATLQRMVRAEPHASVMRRYAAATEEATFVFFDARAGDLPLSWAEVSRRLDAERDRRATRSAAHGPRLASQSVQAPVTTEPSG